MDHLVTKYSHLEETHSNVLRLREADEGAIKRRENEGNVGSGGWVPAPILEPLRVINAFLFDDRNDVSTPPLFSAFQSCTFSPSHPHLPSTTSPPLPHTHSASPSFYSSPLSPLPLNPLSPPLPSAQAPAFLTLPTSLPSNSGLSTFDPLSLSHLCESPHQYHAKLGAGAVPQPEHDWHFTPQQQEQQQSNLTGVIHCT